MTTKSLVRLAVLPGPRAYSRRLALQPSKASPQGTGRGARLLEYSYYRTYHRTHRSPDLSKCRSTPASTWTGRWRRGSRSSSSRKSSQCHHFLRMLKMPHLKSRNGRSQRLLAKRQTGKGYGHKLRWKSTWLPRSELGDAQRLLQEFKAQGRAQ